MDVFWLIVYGIAGLSTGSKMWDNYYDRDKEAYERIFFFLLFGGLSILFWHYFFKQWGKV